jgi:hypothetical protein
MKCRSIEQALPPGAGEAARNSVTVMNSAQSINVREGDVTGMPLSVVTSSGCSGGPGG